MSLGLTAKSNELHARSSPQKSFDGLGSPTYLSTGIDSVYRSPWTAKHTRVSFWLIPTLLWLFAGCTDGPFFELKKLNPIIQQQWKEDRQRGPVFSQRVEELHLLRAQFRRMPEAEQSQWISTVSSVLETETSPEIRRESVLALTEVIQRPEATATIVKLARDKNDKVRLQVAKSLNKHVTPETTQTLLALATNDSSQSVRLAATESLGTHKTDEVKLYLMKQLNDRSPAMQYHTSLALREFTGKDFKGDMSMWKRYLEGEAVEPPPPSLAESIQTYLPFRR
jgi:hypothetical protein